MHRLSRFDGWNKEKGKGIRAQGNLCDWMSEDHMRQYLSVRLLRKTR